MKYKNLSCAVLAAGMILGMSGMARAADGNSPIVSWSALYRVLDNYSGPGSVISPDKILYWLFDKSHTDVKELLRACYLAVDSSKYYNACIKFVQDVITEHNNMVDNYLKSLSDKDFTLTGEKIYTDDRDYYVSRILFNVQLNGLGAVEYAVFDAKTDKLFAYMLPAMDGDSHIGGGFEYVVWKDTVTYNNNVHVYEDIDLAVADAESRSRLSMNDANCANLIRQGQIDLKSKSGVSHRYLSVNSDIYRQIEAHNKALSDIGLGGDGAETPVLHQYLCSQLIDVAAMKEKMGNYEYKIGEFLEKPITAFENVETKTPEQAYALVEKYILDAIPGVVEYAGPIKCEGTCNTMWYNKDTVECILGGTMVRVTFEDICDH